jgi:hypothetical protein
MALIQCPDCFTQVSDQAPACPKCARPILLRAVEATRKKWKAVQLVGGLILVVGMPLMCGGVFVESNPGLDTICQGFWTAVVGVSLMVLGRTGEWWFCGPAVRSSR